MSKEDTTIVLNKTSRQYNLKCLAADGSKVVVRLAPGVNEVVTDHWKHFAGDGKQIKRDVYAGKLLSKNMISIGKDADDAALDSEATEVVSKSKVIPAAPKSNEKAD